jgi:hypothetical protein
MTDPSPNMASEPSPEQLPTENTNSFANDPNISFDKETGKWRYETDDGKELEYDALTRTWVPIVRLSFSWPSCPNWPPCILTHVAFVSLIARRRAFESAASGVFRRRCR